MTRRKKRHWPIASGGEYGLTVHKTQGLSPKVPCQALTTLVVAALAYFGVELDPEVSAAVGVVVGFVAGYLAPNASVTTERKGPA